MGAFYVYALVDPRDDAVFYVGKGSGARMYVHERQARGVQGINGKKLARIAQIHAAGMGVVHRVIADHLQERDALALERRTIAELRDQLTNVMDGGMPTSELEAIRYRAQAMLAQGADWLGRTEMGQRLVRELRLVAAFPIFGKVEVDAGSVGYPQYVSDLFAADKAARAQGLKP